MATNRYKYSDVAGIFGTHPIGEVNQPFYGTGKVYSPLGKVHHLRPVTPNAAKCTTPGDLYDPSISIL
ncbi:hypothetical protein E1B28_005478 [Marasmius oreades]|uniref:Uncharacterized protein n=1 Tax=Marasmius oreades TaxID=181124 RepID=A0A9P7UUV1_9AGAR|nr:uncharacterized protein E1B28_005478 [Marasmius oreades]KAG7094655.1 hypothetical protein E1B28_005478 [Marasmius oreades]